LQLAGAYAAVVAFSVLTIAIYVVGGLATLLQHLTPADPMIAWGVIVFVGLWLILADVKPVAKAKLMGNPMLIHGIVIGSGLWIHGGSADGAMAAIISVRFSALYVRWQQRMYGFIRRGRWHPGVLRAGDPRLGATS